nr:MAG TPA: hypothetical protein [Caudoviricetes sp.]
MSIGPSLQGGGPFSLSPAKSSDTRQLAPVPALHL